MKRTSFGSGKGEGKVGAIGDNRYGLREEYDPEVKDVNLQTVTTVKGPKVKFKEWLFQRFFKDHLDIIKKAKKLLKCLNQKQKRKKLRLVKHVK